MAATILSLSVKKIIFLFGLLFLGVSFYTIHVYNERSVFSRELCPVVDYSRSDVADAGRQPMSPAPTNVSDPARQRESLINRPMRGTMLDCVTWMPSPSRSARAATGAVKPLEYPNLAGEEDDQRLASFVNVYNKQAWGGKTGNASTDDNTIKYKASGPGSALDHSQGVIAVLHTIIDRLKIELQKDVIKLLDLPCGDHQYMTYFLKTRDDIEYTGADIVPALIKTHTNMYSGNTRLKFKLIDIVNGTLEESYDIILCRMMLQHLKHIDVVKALYHFSSSGSKYLIATTFSNTKQNTELNTSGYRFRTLNLELAPINLSPPVCSSLEPIGKDHYLDMWQLPLTQKM